jgi:hypothetical protein
LQQQIVNVREKAELEVKVAKAEAQAGKAQAMEAAHEKFLMYGYAEEYQRYRDARIVSCILHYWFAIWYHCLFNFSFDSYYTSSIINASFCVSQGPKTGAVATNVEHASAESKDFARYVAQFDSFFPSSAV